MAREGTGPRGHGAMCSGGDEVRAEVRLLEAGAEDVPVRGARETLEPLAGLGRERLERELACERDPRRQKRGLRTTAAVLGQRGRRPEPADASEDEQRRDGDRLAAVVRRQAVPAGELRQHAEDLDHVRRQPVDRGRDGREVAAGLRVTDTKPRPRGVRRRGCVAPELHPGVARLEAARPQPLDEIVPAERRDRDDVPLHAVRPEEGGDRVEIRLGAAAADAERADAIEERIVRRPRRSGAHGSAREPQQRKPRRPGDAGERLSLDELEPRIHAQDEDDGAAAARLSAQRRNPRYDCQSGIATSYASASSPASSSSCRA